MVFVLTCSLLMQAGTYNDEGTFERFFSQATECKECPIGRYQSNPGGSECRKCPLGYVSDAKATQCTPCGAGQFQEKILQDSCKLCPAGKAENSLGSTGCNTCPEGFFAAAGATSCQRCPRGRYGDVQELAACKACDAGKAASSEGMTSCHNCGLGRFQGNAGQSGCPRCPGGYYQPTSGQSTCILADAGYYAPVGARRQDVCPMGRYASVPGSHAWTCEGPVQAGRYSRQVALTSSTGGNPCPAGRYGRAGETHEDCTGRCPAGYFCQEGTGIHEWEECGDISLYCPYGSSSPRLVPEGFYASGNANTQGTARRCELGYFCETSRRHPCPAGRYGDVLGLTSPTCIADCENGFVCPPGSSSPRQQECSPQGNALHYCQNGFQLECPDGYTTPTHGSRKTRTGCLPCPHRFRCFNGERLEKIQWRDGICRYHRLRDTVYVPTVEKEDSPATVGDIFSTTVRVPYDHIEYFVSSIVQSGRTLEGGTCNSDVTDDSPLTMATTEDPGRFFDGIQQMNGQLKVKSGSSLKFADCGRYDIRIGATIIESGVDESANVSASVSEFCSFALVVEHVNSPPEKLEEFGSIEDPEYLRVFRGAAFDESFGEPLARMFIDPDGQELTFTLAEEDRSGNAIADHPFSVGACTGQLKVNDPLELIQTPYEQFTIAILVSDNAPDDPGELLQEVIIDVIQPNRPPRVAERPPVLFVIELSPVGTQVTTLDDPEGNNITSIIDPAFVVDPDGDTIQVVFDPCTRENYCSAFSLTPSGDLTVRDTHYISFQRPMDLVRFVRVRYTDGKADPVPAMLEVSIQELRKPPVITSTELSFYEDAAANSEIGQLTAHDTGESFHFVVLNAENNREETDDRIAVASDGGLRVAEESYFDSILCVASNCINCSAYDSWIELTVTAEILDRTDILPGPTVSEPTKVRLSIILVNQAPYYSPREENITVAENLANVAILDVSEHFCDREGTTMFFSLANHADDFARQFSLSSAGILEVSDAFDYETIQQVKVPIVVQDTGFPSREREETLTVFIVDVPEAPFLDLSENLLEVDELTTHEDGIFGQIFVTDPDIYAGTNKPFSSRKSVYQFDQLNLQDKLELGEDGSISIREGYVPDYETLFVEQNGEPSLLLQFAVVDIVHNMTTTLAIDIHILDVPEPPFFEPPTQNFTINVFSQEGDTLGDVVAATPDFGDSVEVVLVREPLSVPVGSQASFALQLRRNGQLLVTPGSQPNLVDEDVGKWYSFYVQAINGHGFNITARHFIEVTNPPQRPLWVKPFRSPTEENDHSLVEVIRRDIYEHYGDNNQVYNNFSPECNDPNNRGYQFQILSVNPRLFDDIFGFSRHTGQLSVLRPSLLDYEPLKRTGNEQVTFEVVCIDTFNLQTNLVGQLILTVKNIPEPPRFVDIPSQLTISVKEDVDVGHFISSISAFDQDFESQNKLVFSLLGTGEMPIAASEPIFTDEGHVGTVNLTVSIHLDFYRASSYDLTLRVEDEEGLSDERQIRLVVVFVNTPPKFDNSTYSVWTYEDATNENVLAIGQTEFPFYDRNRDTSHVFTVTWSDPPGLLNFVSNGLRLVSGQRVNYETIWFHEFGIRVSDDEGLYDEVNVTLFVKNVNDIKINQVVFSPHSTSGGSITTLNGEDLGPIWRFSTIHALVISPGGHMKLESECSRSQLTDGWDNTKVECIVPPGIGRNLQWTLHVDEDHKVAPSVTHFVPPVLTGIQWPQQASTMGGEQFLLEGENFGPPQLTSSKNELQPNPVRVQYRSYADSRVGVLVAAGCIVLDDTHMMCTTVQGAGSALEFQIQAAASHDTWRQLSSWLNEGTIRYNPPSINKVTQLFTELPTTGLNEAFLLEGRDFGPSVALIAPIVFNDWISWDVSCSRLNHTFLVCDLPEGLGSNFVWEVTVADQKSTPSSEDQSFSYDNPSLESIQDVGGNVPQDLNTNGNEFVYLHGSNFGPAIGATGGSGILVHYGENLEYKAAQCVVELRHVRVRCLTVPGIGKNQSWNIHAGKQISNRLIGVSNYHPPVVATYSRASSSDVGGIDDLQTPGHEVIIVHGRHFGPPGTVIDEATYGSENFTLTAISCDVKSFTRMECLTSPGAGAQHFWTVQIGGQLSDVATTSYERPRISYFEGVNGSDPQRLSTIGGELIDIVGENFGPPELSESLLENVLYGLSGNSYTATDCIVLSHERVRCRTVEGQGQLHRWIVIVAGQSSEFSTATTSYAPPVLHQLTPSRGPTGFYSSRQNMPSIRLNGTDLGANLVETLPIRLFMDVDGKLRRLQEQGIVAERITLLADVLHLQQQDPSRFWDNVDNVGFPASAFQNWLDSILTIDINPTNLRYIGGVKSSDQEIMITLPQGFGTVRPVFVSVGNTFSLPLTFDYDPPHIEVVSPAILSNNQIRLTIFGANFCGGKSCDSSVCCGKLFIDDTVMEVPEDQYFHDEIKITMHISSLRTTRGGFPKGDVEIHVLDQPTISNIRSFQQPLPEIPLQVGRVRLDGFRTRGGELFLLYDIKEIQDTHSNEEVIVTIGGKQCTSLQITSTVYEESTQTSFGNISCLTPPHMGERLLVSLSVSGSEVPRSDVEVDYAPPRICLVELNDTESAPVERVILFKDEENCGNTYLPAPDVKSQHGVPTEGGVVLAKGFNLGSSDFDLDPIVSIPGVGDGQLLLHDHEVLRIEIPPGSGGASKNRKTEIWVSDFQPAFTFHYNPPQIKSITPTEIPTNPSMEDRLIISGSDFGPPTGDLAEGLLGYRPEILVTVGDVECQIVGSNHTFIECIPPVGQGDNIEVKVSVDAQEDFAIIRYMMPTIESITPPTGPTSGLVDGGRNVNITITGKNFGKEGAVQFMGDKTDVVKYDHEEIIFLLPEGYGEDVPVSVYPSGWNNIGHGTATTVFSYDIPVITSVFRVGNDNNRLECTPFERCTTFNGEQSCVLEHPDCFPTSGEVRVEVSGNNFGPSETWSNPMRNPPPVRVNIQGHANNVATEKSSTTPHTQLFFELPAGIGKDLFVRVLVDGRSSSLNPEDSVTFSYDPPRISNIMPNNPDAMGMPIQFRGANFGPIGSTVEIRLGNVTCLDAAVREPHTVITCNMQPDIVGPKRIDMNVAEREMVFPEWLELFVSECKRGWYGLQGEICLFCEEEQPGAVCPGNERWYDLIFSEEGWWRINQTTPGRRCHPERQNREECPVFLPCEPKFACLGNNVCAKEYSGIRCSECASGYFRFGGLCQSCPDHAWLLAVGLALAVVGMCVGGYLINSKGVRLAAFTIGVDYFQVIALFAGTRVRWPETMERTLQALSFFNLNIELAAPECWMSPPPTYEIRWMATMAVPLLAFTLLFLVYVSHYAYKLLILRYPSNMRHTHVNSIIATAVVIIYVLYIFVTRQTLDIFNCAPTDPPDGNLYMAGRTDVICGKSSVHVNLLLPLASICLVVYVSAFPIFSFFLLKKNKENSSSSRGRG